MRRAFETLEDVRPITGPFVLAELEFGLGRNHACPECDNRLREQVIARMLALATED